MKIQVILASTLAVMSTYAAAADLPARMRAPAPAAVVSTWTGAYAGVFGGYGFGQTKFAPTGALAEMNVPNLSMDHNGALVGAQVGYNYAFANNVVIGAVADLAWSRVKGDVCVETTSSQCDGSPDDSFAKGKISMLSTIRGKLGYALNKDLLVFGSAGFAIARTEARITNLDGGGFPDVIAKKTRTGYALGAGAEYKLTRDWSVGLEYVYANLGTKGYTFTNALVSSSDGVSANAKTHLNIVRASLNYNF